MDAVAKLFGLIDLELSVVAGLMLFVCAVPFIDLLCDLWHS